MYSTNPIKTLHSRFQYTCSRLGIERKHNSWLGCWTVFVQILQTIEYVWPIERCIWAFNIYQEEKAGEGMSTVCRVTCDVLYCNQLGETTYSESLSFEWYSGFQHGDPQDYSFTKSFVGSNDAMDYIVSVFDSAQIKRLRSNDTRSWSRMLQSVK